MLHLLDTDEWSRDGDNLDNGHGQEVDVKQNLKNGKSLTTSQSCETESLELVQFSLQYTNSFVFSARQV